MKWPSWRRPPTGPAALPPDTPGAATPGPPPSQVHPSPALVDLVRHLRRVGGNLRVLDLGPALGSNVEYLRRFATHFCIVDLHASLSEDPGRSLRLPRQPEAVLAELLPPPEPPGFDLILAWDLFDHLERRTLAALGDALLHLAAPGAHLLALCWTHGDMPDRPSAYHLEGDGRYLRYAPRGAERRPCPRWKPGDMEEALPGFEMVHTYLLRHGMREHLMRRRGSPS